MIPYCVRHKKLQNLAGKVAVGGARKYDHVSPFFRELKFLRIKEKHIFDICTTVYKILRRCYPEGFLSFRSVNDMTNSVTRQRDSLYVPRTRAASGGRGRAVTVLGPKLWNELPTTVTQTQNPNTFKANLKKIS